MPRAHCPHCLLVIADDVDIAAFPPAPMRCPHCQLSIAPRRSLPAGARAGATASGAAAGILASKARRQESAEVSAAQVAEALDTVARRLGTTVARLRMIDYQEAVNAGPALPSVASIIEAHGGWKRARHAAAERP